MVTNVNNTGVVQQAQTTKTATTTDQGFISDDESGVTTGSKGDGVTVSIGSSVTGALTGGLVTATAANTNSGSGLANTTEEGTAGSSSGAGSGAVSTNSADILTGAAEGTDQTINNGVVKGDDKNTKPKEIPGEAKQLIGADGKPVKGVFYKKSADGSCEIIIKKEAGDVKVDGALLKTIMGDNYDSNKVTVKLDQDNLKTGDKVGKVSVTTDVGNIIVDNDNDYKQVGGDTNVAKADLTVTGQKDKLILIQDVDVTTEGWNVKGDGKTQNVGSDLKYNISGCDVDIEGHVSNKFTTTQQGASGLMAGNKIDVNTTDVGKIKDTTTMTNDFQVGDKLEQQEIPQTLLDYMKKNGMDTKDIQYKDAKALGVTDPNHFAHGANGGTGLVVMKMDDGSWVISGAKSPQTYQFTKKDVDSGGSGSGSTKPKVSDPFNEVNYNTGAKRPDVALGADGKPIVAGDDPNPIKTTIVDISGLKQQAKGSVYGLDSYTVRNSVNSDAGAKLEGSATQSIDVTGIDYALSKTSGNFINGQANTTTGTIKEEHIEHFTGVKDDLNADPKVLIGEALAKGMTTDDTTKKADEAVTTADTTETTDVTNADGTVTTTATTTATKADGKAATTVTAATTGTAATTKAAT